MAEVRKRECTLVSAFDRVFFFFLFFVVVL